MNDAFLNDIIKHSRGFSWKLMHSNPLEFEVSVRHYVGICMYVYICARSLLPTKRLPPPLLTMHMMGTSSVQKVRDVRQMVDAQNGEEGGDIVEFQAQISRHEADEKAGRIQIVSSRLAAS